MPDGHVRLKRFVVCAALRDGDTVVVGVRHFDPFMRTAIEALGRPFHATAQQGFVDQHGKFMSRREAWTVACEAGQIVRRVGNDDGVLFSENLY